MKKRNILGKSLIYKSQILAFIIHLLDFSWKGELKKNSDRNL